MGDGLSGARRILVVDDDDAVRDMIIEYLEANGFEVLGASGIESMRDAVTYHVFDLVLLDRTMPDGDGLQYVPEIRKGFGIPVILLTALSEATERVRGLDDGADDYISKPFDWGELVARINCVIRRATPSNSTTAKSADSGNRLQARNERGQIAPGRRFAAILCGDVVEYVRLMREDEHETVRHWWKLRDTIIDPALGYHCGRIVKYTGDGFFAEFLTTDEAVRCAIEMQRQIVALNASLPGSRRMQFRMGLNWCSLYADCDDVYGDGINVAARLQEIAQPGGICLSEEAMEQITSTEDARMTAMGTRCLKHIPLPISVYQIDCAQ